MASLIPAEWKQKKKTDVYMISYDKSKGDLSSFFILNWICSSYVPPGGISPTTFSLGKWQKFTYIVTWPTLKKIVRNPFTVLHKRDGTAKQKAFCCSTGLYLGWKQRRFWFSIVSLPQISQISNGSPTPFLSLINWLWRLSLSLSPHFLCF